MRGMHSVKRPECPCVFTSEFFRELVAYLGADPSPIRPWWGWRKLAKQYPGLRRDIEQYIETATTGDPAGAAVDMMLYFGSSRGWAEKVIENAKTGYPASAAAELAWFHGSSLAWAEEIAARMRQRCV